MRPYCLPTDSAGGLSGIRTDSGKKTHRPLFLTYRVFAPRDERFCPITGRHGKKSVAVFDKHRIRGRYIQAGASPVKKSVRRPKRRMIQSTPPHVATCKRPGRYNFSGSRVR